MRVSSAVTLVASAAVTALLMAGCSSASGAGSGSNPPTASADQPLTVYNAQHESLTQAWVDAFTKKTGIKVTVRQGSDYEFSNQLIAEGKASPADVFLTENSPAMTQVENAGLFAPIDQAIIDQVPEQYRPSSNKWTGIAARATVFAYNKDKLDAAQLPKSIMDLEDPAWKGRWGASATGADFQAIVSAILEQEGEPATAKWLQGMKQNTQIYKGNSAVMKAVNAGEIDGGVIYHYYWFGDQARGGENSDHVALEYFKHQDPGAFVSISGGGVLASSDQQTQAQELLEFITGPEGQKILQTGTSFEYAVGSDVASNPELVPLADLQAPAIDPAKLNSSKVTELMIAAGLL